MATLILSTVGGFLGPIGGVIGGAVGSVLDQLIFGSFQDPIEGLRLDEMRVPTYDEGSPAPWFLGPKSRVPGQVIWVSTMREAKREDGGGKGGGGGSKTITYDYYVDVAVAFGRETVAITPAILKIWANSQLLYEAGIAWTKTSASISVVKSTENKTFGTGCVNKAWNEYITYSHPTSDFFKGVRSGDKVVVTGCANAANNGTFSVIAVTTPTTGASTLKVSRCSHTWKATSSGFGSLFSTGCTDTSTCTPGVDAAAGASITIVQDNLPVFDKSQLNNVTQYNGSLVQTPNSTIEAREGAGNVPAHRGTVYAVIQGLKVTRWGGTIPGFEALVQESASKTVASAIGDIMLKNGKFTANDFDTTGVSGSLTGMAISGPKPPIDALRSLMLLFDIEVQSRGVILSGVFRNKLFFFDKQNAEIRTITDGDRGARTGGDSGIDLLRIVRTDGQNLPSDVSVSFFDVEREYQPGSVNFKRALSTLQNESRVSLPLTLTPAEATALARKMMWAMWINERLKIEINLPPTYIDLAESDIISLNDHDGKPIKARVGKIDRGNNNLLEVEALEEVVGVYS